MSPEKEKIVLAGICAALIFGCVVALVWVFWTGLYSDIDGLLVILISLSLMVVFSFPLVLTAREQGWLDALPRFGRKKVAPGLANSDTDNSGATAAHTN
jgi:hypothetical protein